MTRKRKLFAGALAVMAMAAIALAGAKGADGNYTATTSGGLQIPVVISTGGGTMQFGGNTFTWDPTYDCYVRTIMSNPITYQNITLGQVPPPPPNYSYTLQGGTTYPGTNPVDSGSMTKNP